MEAIIQAKGLTKSYGERLAVDGVDFSVNMGECFGLLGPNGAGKTTTLKMLSCVSPITQGELLVDGKSVKKDGRAIKAILGVVPQENNLDQDFTVLQNLLVYARYFDIPNIEARGRAQEVLDFIQLSERKDSVINTLSGGMKRRLLIARGLINRPKVLILDEPTTGLDPQARHLVWQQVHTLKSRGTTIVLSTHYMDEAAYLCDRLAIMHLGKIIAEGAPKALVGEYGGQEVVEIRVPPWDKEAALVKVGHLKVKWADAGDAIYLFGVDGEHLEDELGLGEAAVIRRPPSLEDVFLMLTGKGLEAE